MNNESWWVAARTPLSSTPKRPSAAVTTGVKPLKRPANIVTGTLQSGARRANNEPPSSCVYP
jgi:hypothetical protein